MSSSRTGRLVSLSSVLKEHDRAAPWLPRLMRARRLFATVVGPSLAADSDVTGLYGADLVITVRRRAAIGMLESVEPFLMRTLCERLGHPRITRVRYRVDEQLNREDPQGVPRTRTVPQLAAVDIEAIDLVAESLDDSPLKNAFTAWMIAACAANKKRSGD